MVALHRKRCGGRYGPDKSCMWTTTGLTFQQAVVLSVLRSDSALDPDNHLWVLSLHSRGQRPTFTLPPSHGPRCALQIISAGQGYQRQKHVTSKRQRLWVPVARLNKYSSTQKSFTAEIRTHRPPLPRPRTTVRRSSLPSATCSSPPVTNLTNGPIFQRVSLTHKFTHKQ